MVTCLVYSAILDFLSKCCFWVLSQIKKTKTEVKFLYMKYGSQENSLLHLIHIDPGTSCPCQMQNTVLKIFPVPPAPYFSVHTELLLWPLSWLVCYPCSWMLYQRNPIMLVWGMFTDRWFVMLVLLGKPRLQHSTPMVHWVVPASSDVIVEMGHV